MKLNSDEDDLIFIEDFKNLGLLNRYKIDDNIVNDMIYAMNNEDEESDPDYCITHDYENSDY